jgi:hypothetical protein
MVRLGFTFAMFFALFVTGCCRLPVGGSGEKTYNMNVAADNEDGIHITQIVVTPTETRVRMRFQNKEKGTTSIATAPPGKPESFFLEAADQRRRLQLTRSSGIAVSPNRENVVAGGIKEFTIYFPPIDDSWSPVDIHEGEIMKKGNNTFWTFTDVPLR